MAQTLHPTLAAAMDAIDRRPIVKITSAPMVGDIPFAGIPQAPLPDDERIYGGGYPYEGYEEFNPTAIPLSSGETAYGALYGSVIYIGESQFPRHSQMRLVTTTGGGTEFNPGVVIDLLDPGYASAHYLYPDETYDTKIGMTELANGNIGVTWFRFYGYLTYYRVAFHAGEVTPEGAVVYPSGNLYNSLSAKEWWNESPNAWQYTSGPTTIRLANGTYLSVFVHKVDSNYTIWKKTSSDFRTWASKATVTISGIDTTKQISNPSLMLLDDGKVMISFDYTESVSSGSRLRNLYYSISSDNGATWSAATKITDYDSYDVTAMSPAIVQRQDGSLVLVYTELTTVLKMGTVTLGWPTGPGYGEDAGQHGEALSWDPINRKLYVVNCYQSGGGYLENIVKIDVDTWEVDKAWTGLSTPESIPKFPYNYGTSWERTRNDKHLIAVLREMGIDVLDGEADTITTYQFVADLVTPIPQNTTGWPTEVSNMPFKCQVDADAMRLYLFGNNGYVWHPDGAVGFIDLTAPGPNYEVQMIFDERNWGIADVESLGIHDGDFLVVPSADMVFITWTGSGSGVHGGMRIYQLSTGARIIDIRNDSNPGFPYCGLYDICYKDGKIYGNFPYTTNFGQQDRRGIVEINLVDYACVYYRPSYETKDDYRLFGPRVLASGEILFEGWNGEGVVLWDPASSTWTQYTMANLPGLNTDSWVGNVMYDELTGTIFASSNGGGLCAFSRDGFLYRSKMVEGNFTTEWEWGVPQLLTQTWKSYDMSVVLSPSGTMLAFWSNETTPGYRTIVWARDTGSIDLTDYIARGHDITFSRAIDGKPASLEFTVTHGHLFDPTNRGSLWQTYLKKMRKLTLQFGEKVGGVNYWHPQGTFLVRETEVKHRRGEYPTMRVKAEDIRSLWEDMNITATPHYEGTPKAILEEVLTDYGGLSLSDIDLPTFRWSYDVWIQWLDTSIKKMVDQIGTRFGYAIVIDVEGKVKARKIAGDNPVDHEYTDESLVVDWTPDDSFSDFTNRVTVVGESRDFMEVMYQEELIKQLMGTVGWWGHKTTMRIYYSEDQSRRCRYPRLDVIESVRNFNFRLGGGGESMTAIDADERWVEITVEMPDLTGFVIADCIALIALGYEAIVVSGLTGCPGWIVFGICILLSGLFYVVASIAQYQYGLYARPLGHERMSIQSAPPHGDDLVLQTEMGKIIEKKIDEPLCITAAQCNEYADYELSIIKFQRERIRLSKIANLQDDEGDTLGLIQPYSKLAQRIFVTDLVRKMRIPADPESIDDGYFIDEIEGWLVS